MTERQDDIPLRAGPFRSSLERVRQFTLQSDNNNGTEDEDWDHNVQHRRFDWDHRPALSSSAGFDGTSRPSTRDKPLDARSLEHDPIVFPTSSGLDDGTDRVVQAEENEAEAEDDSKYPSGFALIMLTIGLCMAIFVVALDNTIIATAIPKITSVFNSLDDVGWYGSSYLLTTTALQPSFGKVYTYFNVKWTYLTALCIFELGSIICAAAKNSVMLIVGRAVAGAGAAAIFSGGMTIIGFSVPLRTRSIYVAVLASMFGIASIVGPLLGGVLTDRASWRWCFWINLPFGAVVLGTVSMFFKNPKRDYNNLTLKQKLEQMDLLGAGLLISGIVCLLLALQWGGTSYKWSDSKVWGCLLGAGLLMSIFIGFQLYRGEKATIPPRILTQRTVAAACVVAAFLSMGLYTHVYYLPFYFQAVKGTSAEGSGIRTIPYLVTLTIASLVAGGTITRFGWYTPLMWLGCALFTVGAGLLYTLQPNTSTGWWIGYQLVAGAGAGLSIQIPFISMQVVLSGKDLPTGNALSVFFNSLGGAISISVAQNIFSNTLLQELIAKVSAINPSTVIQAGATGVRQVTPPTLLDAVLVAYNIALTSAFILPIAVGGIALIASLFMEWKSVKGMKIEMGGAA